MVLSPVVSAHRRSALVGIGHGGNEQLQRVVRAHANFAENVPFALVLLLLYELTGGTPWVLHTMGTTLLAGRLAHAWGLSRDSGLSFGRTSGVVATHGVVLLLITLNLACYFS